ncbi:hypothetical protein [Comamonas testosteroni]|uniref:hypothetical protein n=1 Tax=Comamonas testosteroni TaxID=285 RepID=UPI0026EF5683|nr:hypothetical protein [Comamonas testosteroni]WQD45114.1 hypothetical protein U0024_10245 [Comamonas testosteroni]
MWLGLSPGNPLHASSPGKPGRPEPSGGAGERARDAVLALFLRMGGGKSSLLARKTMQSLALALARLDARGAHAAP